jgi:hypothetical protein
MTPYENITGKLEIFDALRRERAYQDAKWGTIQQHPHTVGEWLLVVESELLEAKEAWCKGQGDRGALVELVQVAAVVVACLEQHGIVERPGLDHMAFAAVTHELTLLYYSDLIRPANPALADAIRSALADCGGVPVRAGEEANNG